MWLRIHAACWIKRSLYKQHNSHRRNIGKMDSERHIRSVSPLFVLWPLLITLALLTLIPALISNHTHYKMWDEITCLFPNFKGCNVEVWEWINNFITHFIMGVITYPCLTLNKACLLGVRRQEQNSHRCNSRKMALAFVTLRAPLC